MHAERRQNAAFNELPDRNAITTLECELEQDVARVRIDALPAGLFAGARRPGVQHIDEFGQGVRGIWPWRMIGRQQQTGCVGDELANGHRPTIIAVQFGDVFIDGSSSLNSPRSTPSATSVASNNFRTEATLNSVSGVTGRLSASSANPKLKNCIRPAT